jgi:diguanylate cyclase (GGDEF)-like protein
MQPTFDLLTIFIANILGIILIVVLIAGNLWRFRDKTPENITLMVLMLLTLSNCISDPVSYYFDGKPGSVARFIIYASNAWLYTSIMLTGLCWMRFLAIHLNGKFSQMHQGVLLVFIGAGVFLMCANFIQPIVFSVDSNNVYRRQAWYWYYLAVDYGILIDSLIFYGKTRMKGGILKTFPMWAYFVPTLIGALIQSFCYGVSVVAATLAISVAGILASLQNEQIFRDHLTGLFNRNYLEFLLRKYPRIREYKITGIMLNLNNFKKINRTYGHAEGDHVLGKTAQILQAAVGDIGLVTHYSSDEFIVLLKTQSDPIVKTCLEQINNHIDQYNYHNHSEYLLSAAIGTCKLDSNTQNLDDFVNELDKRMYESKREFYTRFAQFDRRVH